MKLREAAWFLCDGCEEYHYGPRAWVNTGVGPYCGECMMDMGYTQREIFELADEPDGSEDPYAEDRWMERDIY